jgi:hypothetical protein
MARGGMVYVKRDISNEEAPRTFAGEQVSALKPWIEWVSAHLSDLSPALPSGKPPAASAKHQASARASFAHLLHKAGEKDVGTWIQIIEGCAPALGFPWEGANGSRYPESRKSWLLAGFDNATAGSGWIEWACASVRLLAKNKQAAEVVLPTRSIVEPWDDQARGLWAYDVLNHWVDASLHQSSRASTFERWTRLVHEIDARVNSLPSPLGLPSHWQMAARQAQACLMREPNVVLNDMGPIIPIHSEVKLASGKSLQVWAGTSEWLVSRFSRQLLNFKAWDAERWRIVKGLIELDFAARTPDSNRLIAPFVEDLKRSIASLTPDPKKNAPSVNSSPENLQAEVEAWCLGMATPQAKRTNRSMRL